MYEKAKPVLAMISVQLGFSGMNIVSKVALNKGMPPTVLVFYRHVVATVFLAPVAYFWERKTRPKLTLLTFTEIFIGGFFGATLNHNLYYAGLNYTSATFAVALANILPAVTFVMAIVFRVEKVGIKTLVGQAKVAGTALCVGGAMLMTLYKGVELQLWPSPFHLKKHVATRVNNAQMIKGPLFVVGACISWAVWFILQAKIGQKYSVPYSSTTLMCFSVSIQSAVLVLAFEGTHPSVWAMGWDIRLLTSLYSGIVASAMAFSIMAWCIRKRGPVFVSNFNPLQLIMVAIMGSISLDEKLHLGSVIGSVVIVVGLYAVLWGKAKEAKNTAKIPKVEANLSNTTPPATSHNRDLVNMQHGEDASSQPTTAEVTKNYITIDCSRSVIPGSRNKD
ncbi:hypothetical protein SUGI_1170090 [Cryptomeria japonica]|nr:hypothetical protein SUGI_1170090 [Cryptomeria japonica]